MLEHISEPELSQRLFEGDEAAFREVFNRFHKKVYQFSFSFLKNKEQSEEIVQDTFLNFWLYRKKLNIEYPIAPLLFTIARRTLIDTWRKTVASNSFKKQIIHSLQSSSNDTEEEVLARDLECFAKEALQQLNEHQQQIFKLSRYEGLSYEEIAERLHISTHTVKYHLVGALKIMRTHFSKYDSMYIYFIVFLMFN